MKPIRFIKALMLLPTLLVAEVSDLDPQFNDIKTEKIEKTRDYTYYIKLGSSAVKNKNAAPLLGFGIRSENKSFATDALIDYSYQDDGDSLISNFSVPKISVLKFFSPEANSSFYAGPSLAWVFNNFLDDHNESNNYFFSGISAGGSAGYEFGRENDTLRHMIQLDIATPTISARSKGEVPNINGQLSYNIGF